MAFAKKQKHATYDTRPVKYDKLKSREHKVKVLKAANNPGARKQLKKMNDVVYRGSRTNLKEWYKPNGKGVTCK